MVDVIGRGKPFNSELDVLRHVWTYIGNTPHFNVAHPWCSICVNHVKKAERGPSSSCMKCFKARPNSLAIFLLLHPLKAWWAALDLLLK